MDLVIEDLDEGAGASRGPMLVRVISVALVVVAVIGWAALQLPALRGPYATPDPSGGVNFKARFTPAPFASVEPAAVAAPGGLGCVVPGSVSISYVFVGGQLVTVTKPSATSNSSTCAALYLSWQQSRVPVDRSPR